MIYQLRSLLRENQKPLSWIGVGIVVLATGFWALSSHFFPSSTGRTQDAARLEADIAAVRDRLQTLSGERDPIESARTQVRLGVALETLGRREDGTARLKEAVSAFQEALNEFSREGVPLDWARTQINLGTTLFRLGEREGGTARYEEAIAAYREALRELTRERVPLEWAQTQESLASVYHALFVVTREPNYLDDALRTVEGALEEYHKANAAFYIENAERLRQQIVTEGN
ncbi:MAG TPA: tetratricopeptide repeat protein [Methylocella sp.]|nr:tetratricopeptide repeat protein [Methylocella sp.]